MKSKTRFLTEAGLIAAAYAATTYLCALWGLAYGEVQFRFSEALTILPLFTPAAIPGLTLGCLIANIGSPLGMVDVVCGSLATLIAAVGVRLVRHVRIKNVAWLAPLIPVVANALIVGLEISWFLPEGLTWAGFAGAALSVGLGELVVCYGLGLPLSILLDKLPIFKKDKD
ncbi:MAG TPA: QueT transporter family protein [Lachnospiraceae bacterium]|nr:QueT transporter family protein [Lachnospiraceae bacterium]